MTSIDEANKWLAKAEADFGFSSSVLPETTFYAQVCFFFQQSAEKIKKGINEN